MDWDSVTWKDFEGALAEYRDRELFGGAPIP
jgi:hypothetical protein